MIVTPQPAHQGNYSRGRGRMIPDLVVIHVTEGTAGSARHWIMNPKAQVSWHYLVTRHGGVEQFVREDDTAWHAGRVERPTSALVKSRPGLNPNTYSIGIEHEGSGRQELTPKQRDASLWLVRDICTRRMIPINRHHIVGHREIYALKTCPGAIDVDDLVRDLSVERRVAPAPPANEPMIVWSDWYKDWLVVVRIVSDTEWYFVPLGEVNAPPRRSTSPLMKMRRKMI